MLKRWRYVGIYDRELMLCVGIARIGPVRQAWWAVWDRESRELLERTHLLRGRGRVQVSDGGAAVRDGGVEIDLALARAPGVEVVTPDPGGYAWTRKQVVPASGHVRAGDREWTVDGRALIDDSAGYHPRRTSWRWSAGTGTLADGRAVAWNLVDGVHDSARDSERTLWLEGEPSELEPVVFEADLRAVRFTQGAELRFSAEATRRRDDNLVVFRSRYEQPFGEFSGTLPGGLELAEGHGVMERHDAVW